MLLKMKKSFIRAMTIFLTAILCGLVFCASANAESGNIRIEDMKMNIMLPQNMIAVTRDSSSSDTYYQTFKLEHDVVQRDFLKSDIFLKGSTTDKSMSITVIMTSDENSQKILNYKDLSTDELNEIKNAQEESDLYIKGKGTIGEYCNGNLICLDFLLSYEQDGQTVNAASSNTVANGMNIMFIFETASAEMSASDKHVIKQILNSITFDGLAVSEDKNPANSLGIWFLIIAIICSLVIGGFFFYKKVWHVKGFSFGRGKNGNSADDSSENLNDFLEGSTMKGGRVAHIEKKVGRSPKKRARIEDYDAFSDNGDFDSETDRKKKKKNRWRRYGK